MKLWIIYKEGIGFSKLIAEMLQDRLEELIDVSVGSAKKVLPPLLLEEQFDYLIIGDIEDKHNNADEINDWLLEFWNVSKNRNLSIKAISGFYVIITDPSKDPLWLELLVEKFNKYKTNPSILRLKLNVETLVLEDKSADLIKEFADEIIDYCLYSTDK
jgi:hypothetical protein